jgi:hypothetical protein
MLNQEAICPYCKVQFRLRERNSVEYQQKREEELDRAERRLGQVWFRWAVVTVVIAILGVVLLVAASID